MLPPESELPMPASDISDERARIALVTTTVHVPRCLEEYLENAQQHGHADRLTVIVIGDRKTPVKTAGFLKRLGRRYTARVQYLDIARQQALLRRWPAFDLLLRYDSMQRRNVGFLQAAIEGAEVIISIDDDHFVGEGDFFGTHMVVGQDVEVPTVTGRGGWWNVYERLTSDPPRRFYYHGYPHSRRDWRSGDYEVQTSWRRAVVNVGYCLNRPDVDATTSIEEPIYVKEISPLDGHDTCSLAAGTWCPFNTHNTAFHRSALPAMYLPVMHDSVGGVRVGRFDDTWMSYFLRTIADQFDEAVLYGSPLVTQYRNPRDSTRDLELEVRGYQLTEKLIEFLRTFQTREESYQGAYVDLIYHLRCAAEDDPDLDRSQRDYLRHMTVGMAIWHSVVAEILNPESDVSAGDHFEEEALVGDPW